MSVRYDHIRIDVKSNRQLVSTRRTWAGTNVGVSQDDNDGQFSREKKNKNTFHIGTI